MPFGAWPGPGSVAERIASGIALHKAWALEAQMSSGAAFDQGGLRVVTIAVVAPGAGAADAVVTVAGFEDGSGCRAVGGGQA